MSAFRPQRRIKLEIQNTWSLNTCIKEEISKEILKYFELNENATCKIFK